MKNKVFFLLTLFLLISLSVGCISKEFDSNYKQFKESYILATDFLDSDKDSLKALKNMDLDSFENELKKMKETMDSMSTETNSKGEKGIYGNVKNYYEGLEFLLYANKNFDKLTTEEKRKVYVEAIFASMNRKSITRGDE